MEIDESYSLKKKAYVKKRKRVENILGIWNGRESIEEMLVTYGAR